MLNLELIAIRGSKEPVVEALEKLPADFLSGFKILPSRKYYFGVATRVKASCLSELDESYINVDIVNPHASVDLESADTPVLRGTEWSYEHYFNSPMERRCKRRFRRV